jgi:hypothetical protein
MTNTDIAQVIPPNEPDLATLAEQINAEHAECKSALIKGGQRALNAGKLLLRAKELAGHGNWTEWLAANTNVGERQAQRYMEIAANEQKILARAPNLRELTMTGAIKLIEPLKDPEEPSGISGRGSNKNRKSPVDSAIEKDALAILKKAWRKCNEEQQDAFRQEIA